MVSCLVELEKVFNKKNELNVTMGAEMEIYLLVRDDLYEDKYVLNEDNELTREIYECLDERVFRDYYPYQIEIRTNPSDDPRDIYKELVELFEETKKICSSMDCILIPISYLENSIFNGFHVHVSYTPRIRYETMIKRIISAYPFIIDISRLTLSSPERNSDFGKILSKRIVSEMHITTIPVNLKIESMKKMWIDNINIDSTVRYYDIILNANRRDGRHRVKDIVTIETRIFDVVGSREYLRHVLELTYEIYKSVNPSLFEKYLSSSEGRTLLFRLFKSLRFNLVKSGDYINPLTGTTSTELGLFFLGKLIPEDSWIYSLWWSWNEFKKIEYQQNVRYLIS